MDGFGARMSSSDLVLAQVLSSAFCCVALVSGFKKRQDGLPEIVSSPLSIKSRENVESFAVTLAKVLRFTRLPSCAHL